MKGAMGQLDPCHYKFDNSPKHHYFSPNRADAIVVTLELKMCHFIRLSHFCMPPKMIIIAGSEPPIKSLPKIMLAEVN